MTENKATPTADKLIRIIISVMYCTPIVRSKLCFETQIIISSKNLMILTGKQQHQKKFKYARKVSIPRFSMYKNQCFLEVLMLVIVF